MDKNKDLAEKIYWILIEEGQRNLKIPLGSVITNTPDEVRDIVRKHIKDSTQKTDELIKQNLLKAFADHDYPITYPDGSRGRGMGYGDFEKLINNLT